MKIRLLILTLSASFVNYLYPQNWQFVQTHYEPAGTKTIYSLKNDNQWPFQVQDNIFTTESRSGFNYLDTLYKVRYNTDIYDILEDSDYYYLVGKIGNMTSSTWDSINHTILYRMKLSTDGSVIWTKEDSLANGYHYYSYNHSIVKLADNSFLAMGYLYNDFKHPKNYECTLPIFTKFNSNGDIIWQHLIADTVGMRSGFWPQDILADVDA